MKSDILRVSTKGRVTIPSKMRKRFGICPGMLVAFQEEGGHLLIQPLSLDFVKSFRGVLKRGATLKSRFDERAKLR